MTAPGAISGEDLDLVLSGGTVIDGTGAPRRRADVAIRDGRIVGVGDHSKDSARRRLDSSGLIVAPGFVDVMGQTATPLLEDPKHALNLLSQGITTINAGEGISAAPLSGKEARAMGWSSFHAYFALLDLRGLPVNVVQTIGHTQVRRAVIGDGDRSPSEDELERMQGLVRDAMEAGAIGLSTALIYPPATYSTREEIAALASVAGTLGGGYFTHLRNEGDLLIEALEEAIAIGRAARTPVHIFHLKTAGTANHGKLDAALETIARARADGLRISADVYPYVHNGLGIAAFIHPRHFTRGRRELVERLGDENYRRTIRDEIENETGWENWYRHVGKDWSRVLVGTSAEAALDEFRGRSVADIAAALGVDAWDAFFRLVRATAFVLPESMSEENKIRLLQEPGISLCTDVGPASGSAIASHPRAWGAFPRVFARYVREFGALSMEDAVVRASSNGAAAVLLLDRGRIAPGLAADIVIFDPTRFADRATFTAPATLAEGVRSVIVNGEIVYEEGKLTGARPGRVLRGPGYREETKPSAIATGRSDPRLSSFDGMMKAFLDRHRVPGAAIAVTRRGKLVYARGFGYTDVETREAVTPRTLFRVASLSKPITGAAVMRAIEKGHGSLDDPIFASLGLDETISSTQNADPRLRTVTIRQLLEHRGGWDRDRSFDPMFQSVRFATALGVTPPATAEDVIRAMLSVRLDFDPGTGYAYSNFGYALLGRWLERKTSKSYEDWVREETLAPLGIHRMRLGRTRIEDSLPGESRYYDPARGSSVFASDLGAEVPHPYGAWSLEAMDAHGGWLADVVELARFASAFDDPNACPILSAEGVRRLFARPDSPSPQGAELPQVWYSLGWQNRAVAKDSKLNSWHTGSLPGTATLLVRRHDGLAWAILLNARVSPTAQHLAQEIDRLVHGAADAVTEWPEDDLFPELLGRD
jgi:N-acyl-D-amino-acid deacylase